MNRARAAFWNFWLAPAPRAPLVFFRRAIAILCLLQLALTLEAIEMLYGNRGFIQWSILENGGLSELPTVGKLARLLYPLGLNTSHTLWLVVAVYAGCLLGLLGGRRP